VSLDARKDSPHERLLADLYVQAEALEESAADRARAVDRFMETRAALLRQRRRRRVLPATLSRAAALAVCAISAGLVSNGWHGVEAEPEPAAAPVEASSIEPITLPAREREENLQSTPDDVRRPNESTRSVPRLELDTASGSASSARIYLRGVGNGAPISTREVRAGNFARFDSRDEMQLRITPAAAAETQLSADRSVEPSAPSAPSTPAEEEPKPERPSPLDLAAPIQLAPPSAERLRELEAQRGNDMAEVLPPLGSATLDPCATPERVGAAVPAGAADEASRVDARCPRDER
jgi:hypothetical protein